MTHGMTENHQMDDLSPLGLAKALIRCRSVTPDEGGALNVLAKVLSSAGFAVERVIFSAPGTPDIDNLYARYGKAEPCLVFAGHTDVVPPGDLASWTRDPFGADIVDGEIYGRGAVDMKGGVAAFVAAAIAYIKDKPNVPGSIAFLITGDEEGPAINGTVKLLDWAKARGERFAHCLLGEPTSVNTLGDMIKIGRRGSLTGRVVLSGVQGHVAYPHRADNPARRLARVLEALHVPLDEGTAHFAATNLEVTTIDTGNSATNVIASNIRLTFNVRFNDLWSPASLEAELHSRLDQASDGHASLTCDPTNAVAFLTAPGPFVDLVSSAVARTTGQTPALSTTGGTSDARFIKDYCPVVEFGLVGSTMHQVDERVPVADLEALAVTYRAILDDYFKG
jgi:succinyl-diaminopimelate desuccinylase